MDSRPTSEIPEAARRLFAGLCNYDVDEVSEGLCDDARLNLPSRNAVVGRSMVRRTLARILGFVHSIRLDPVVVWAERNLAVIEADVNCERLDSTRVIFPVTVVLCFRDGLISEIRFWTYEPAGAGLFGVFPG